VFLSVVIYPPESCPLPLARVRVRVGYFVGEFTPLNPPLLRGETGILSPLVKGGNRNLVPSCKREETGILSPPLSKGEG